MGGRRRNASAAAVPDGLVAERFEANGVEFVVFTWEPREGVAALSPSERAVCELIASGASNAEIARARKTSARTVANQLASAFRKLGVSSRFELIARFAGM